MLMESDLSVARIAHDVGFSDQSYFDRKFRSFFGKTPREFRMQLSGRRKAPDPSHQFFPNPQNRSIRAINDVTV